MRLEDEGVRREFKKRMRKAREEQFKFSQEEMARHLQGQLDPENPKYPGLRTYARWESEAEGEYLPPTVQKMTELAHIMGFQVDDLVYPTEMPAQFFLARRLDALVGTQTELVTEAKRNIVEQEKQTDLLHQILAALQKM